VFVGVGRVYEPIEELEAVAEGPSTGAVKDALDELSVMEFASPTLLMSAVKLRTVESGVGGGRETLDAKVDNEGVGTREPGRGVDGCCEAD
jgi:hypothetical protein